MSSCGFGCSLLLVWGYLCFSPMHIFEAAHGRAALFELNGSDGAALRGQCCFIGLTNSAEVD